MEEYKNNIKGYVKDILFDNTNGAIYFDDHDKDIKDNIIRELCARIYRIEEALKKAECCNTALDCYDSCNFHIEIEEEAK